MKQFLSKFLSAEEVEKIEEAFKNKNTDSSGLPIYIPKSRFDEVDAKRKLAEENLKAVPTDWKAQLDNLNAQITEQKQTFETKLTEQKTGFEAQIAAIKAESERTAKVYGSGARNVKAVMALIDPNKAIDEQLVALQKSDPYLFNTSNVPKGTGKGDNGHGGEGDEKGRDHRLSVENMYRAVGIVPPADK